MSLNRTSRVPGVPTLPRGEQIASYPTYLEAQKAVDHLSDKEFPVQHVTIVGADLKMVERVTGRLTYSRVALAGLASGAWFGLFVGLLLSLFSGAEQAAALPILPAIAIGAAFGILFSVISYALTGGKRDFTSSSQIVASSYAILCAAEHAPKARSLLATIGATTGPGAQGPAAAPTTAAPTQPAPQAPAAPPAVAPPAAAPPTVAPPASGSGTEVPPAHADAQQSHPDVPPTQPPAGPQS
jgi:hypothetical protein